MEAKTDTTQTERYGDEWSHDDLLRVWRAQDAGDDLVALAAELGRASVDHAVHLREVIENHGGPDAQLATLVVRAVRIGKTTPSTLETARARHAHYLGTYLRYWAEGQLR